MINISSTITILRDVETIIASKILSTTDKDALIKHHLEALCNNVGTQPEYLSLVHDAIKRSVTAIGTASLATQTSGGPTQGVTQPTQVVAQRNTGSPKAPKGPTKRVQR